MVGTDFASLFQSAGLEPAEYDELVRLVYQGPQETVPWTGFMERLRKRLDANYVSLILRPPSPEQAWQVVFAGEARPAIAETYDSFFYAVDPFVNLPVDRVMTVDELVNEEDWLRSAIYKDFLAPLNVRYYLGADVGGGDEPSCRLRISRPAAGGPFGSAEKSLCQLLLPHLKSAVRLRNLIDVAEAERRLYSGTLERLSVGAVILDKKGRVLRSNLAADEILAGRDGLSVVNGTLQASFGSENRELHRLIEQAIGGESRTEPHVAEGMSLSRSSGRANLGIVVRSAPLTEWSESGSRPAAVVIIRDVEHKLQASHATLKRLYGLTPAESALALQLLDGLTVDEASEQLHISRNTARCQLRAIFAKTGVTRQTELLRLLLSGVAPLA